MKEKIVTENADIEVLANGEAISLCISDTECGGQTCCSWLDGEQTLKLSLALMDAFRELCPMDITILDGEEDDLES